MKFLVEVWVLNPYAPTPYMPVPHGKLQQSGKWIRKETVEGEDKAEAAVRKCGKKQTARATSDDGRIRLHADPSSFYRMEKQ